MIGESMDLPTQAHAMGYLSLAWGLGTILGTLLWLAHKVVYDEVVPLLVPLLLCFVHSAIPTLVARRQPAVCLSSHGCSVYCASWHDAHSCCWHAKLFASKS